MRPLAEGTLHSGSQGDARLAEFVADPVHGGQGMLPFLA